MTDKPFSRTVPVTDISREPRHYRLEADSGERVLLAETLGIPEVGSLEAEIEIRPLLGHSYGVRGSLKAEVVQTCVVTLEPVPETVAETIDVTLVPAPVAGAKDVPVLVDAEAEGGPSIYENGRIELGTIVTEHLALGLDPYPRKPGVDFPGHIEDLPGPDESPFAKLAALKARGD
jgi:uncharacterized protein